MSKAFPNTSAGFYDLNLSLKTSPNTTLKEVAVQAVKLGYTSLVINTVLDEEYLLSTKKKAKKNDGQAKCATKEIPPPQKLTFSESDLKSVGNGKNISLYHRLTVSISDPSDCHKLVQSENAKKYDILAVNPTTAAAFQYSVTNLDVDIVSLDPEIAGSFKINRRQYFLGVSRGIFYELSYSSLLRDSTVRKKVIQLAHLFHAVGKSKNIIVTSGASSLMELRGPHDIINLSLLLGLSEGDARGALTTNCRSVLLHAVGRIAGKCLGFIEHGIKEDWRLREASQGEGLPEAKKIKLDS